VSTVFLLGGDDRESNVTVLRSLGKDKCSSTKEEVLTKSLVRMMMIYDH